MVRRAKDLIGKPVLSAANGKRLGTVADLLLDEYGTSVVGYVLQHGWLRSEDVLPAASLQALGPDALVSRSSDVISAKEWRERYAQPDRAPQHSSDDGVVHRGA